ncbi:MAG: hypothetical protein V7K57_27595 [Nostoc sp.]|uniref:hypothetical protein n=1 Tax=Nostoc sp. TaxID=1180 RepID=UPI002FF85442
MFATCLSGTENLGLSGYVSTIVGISGFNPRTRLCLIQYLNKEEGDLIFEWSFFLSITQKFDTSDRSSFIQLPNG